MEVKHGIEPGCTVQDTDGDHGEVREINHDTGMIVVAYQKHGPMDVHHSILRPVWVERPEEGVVR